jgi:hypothetical protein
MLPSSEPCFCGAEDEFAVPTVGGRRQPATLEKLGQPLMTFNQLVMFQPDFVDLGQVSPLIEQQAPVQPVNG